MEEDIEYLYIRRHMMMIIIIIGISGFSFIFLFILLYFNHEYILIYLYFNSMQYFYKSNLILWNFLVTNKNSALNIHAVIIVMMMKRFGGATTWWWSTITHTHTYACIIHNTHKHKRRPSRSPLLLLVKHHIFISNHLRFTLCCLCLTLPESAKLNTFCFSLKIYLLLRF